MSEPITFDAVVQLLRESGDATIHFGPGGDSSDVLGAVGLLYAAAHSAGIDPDGTLLTVTGGNREARLQVLRA